MICFLTSSRADFGLIFPIVKFAFKNKINFILFTAGESSKTPKQIFQNGIGDFKVERIDKSATTDRMKSHEDTVINISRIIDGSRKLLADKSHIIDWVIIPGDRFEVFAVAIAAYYLNIPISHLFAGDRTVGGHLDDNVRHSITKLSHVHFAVCEDSYKRIIRMGEEPFRVFNVGSPIVELVKNSLDTKTDPIFPRQKLGHYKFLLTYHSITTEPENAWIQFKAIIQAIEIVKQKVDVVVIVTYPNNEPGSELIVREIKQLHSDDYLVYKSLGWKKYLDAMREVDLVLGNSSSLMLEAPIVGTPALNIGLRQEGRFSPSGVFHVKEYNSKLISDAIFEIIGKEAHLVQHPYGEGNTSKRVITILNQFTMKYSRNQILKKRISY